MLGMAWGIATVVLLLAYGTGFQRGLMVAFRTFGGNLIVERPDEKVADRDLLFAHRGTGGRLGLLA